MYAIVEIKKTQYKIEPGTKITALGKFETNKEKTLTFDKILFLSRNGETLIGNPYIKNAKCTAEILGQRKGKKVLVFKFKSKARYRKRKGHRSLITDILIKDITF